MTMLIQSDKCNTQLSLCTIQRHMGERGGKPPHIINPVLLHTALTQYTGHHCQYVNLPSPPQHFISYQTEQLTLSLITYLGVLIFMGYDFWPNLPTQHGTKWDFGKARLKLDGTR